MNQSKPAWCILLLLTLLFVGESGQTFAQEREHHAGLVLQFADGSTKTYCVAFDGESITGLDLLLKTGLEVRVESFGGAGAMICKIGPDGCDFPEEPCVCQSYGPGGVYWSYHHLKAGRWATSGVGVSSYQLHDGDVDGLAWSAGKPPPLTTFSQVCSAAQVGPPTEAQATATDRPPSPVPTKPPATSTLQPLRPTPTRQPTLPPPLRPPATATPTSDVRASSTTPTHTSTAPPATATSTLTSGARPTDSPTPRPASTATAPPTLTMGATDTALPTRIVGTQTPVAAVIDAHSDPGEAAARNIALAIGVVTLAALGGWGIWRGRRKRGPDVG